MVEGTNKEGVMRKIMGEAKEVQTFRISGDDEVICDDCGKRGYRRFDRGLAAGVHCDECWNKLVGESHSKSW